MKDEERTEEQLRQDVAELRQRVKDLETSLEAHVEIYKTFLHLAAIVESSEDAIIGKTLDSIVTSWNASAEEIYGYSADEIIGRPISLLIPPGQHNEVPEIIGRIQRGELVKHYETVRQRKDGKPIAVSLTISPIKDATGRIIGASTIARDITERKQADEKLKQTMEELQRSNAELEQFAYVASHDLQEPLRMVSSFTQLLARRYKGKLDADADEYIGYTVDGATRMQMLINDLLSYSRVTTRGKPFEPTNCELVLGQVLSNLQTALAESNAEITHASLPTVSGDASQLAQLFQNLIGNAIKFRRSDEPLHVHISAEQQGGEWVFSVRDNGIGIDPKYADRIFVVFQRLHNQKAYSGTGIGLAICKKIVERHGGRIWLESQLGEGSTFLFALPKKKGGVVPIPVTPLQGRGG